jgi:hypothetical protein
VDVVRLEARLRHNHAVTLPHQRTPVSAQ